jgi:hypothetical protein
METLNSDVPTFKLAKVGQDRKKKRGGGAWFSGGQGGGSGLGSLLGAGEGAGGMLGEGAGGLFGMAGMTAGKALVALLIAAGLSAGAWQIGKMFGPGSGAPVKGQKLFADKGGKYGDLSDVVKGSNSIPNSLGYVSGSLDGLTPEERAKKAAEEEAARKAAEEAAKKQAEEDAAKKAASDAAPTDATAGTATGGPGSSGGGVGSNPFGSRFGSLSSSLGGGLAGGSGLSGGIGQGFGSSNLSKGTKGDLTAMAAAAKPTSSTARAMPKSGGKGNAFGQLQGAQRASQGATGTAGETSATTAGQPFDGGIGGGGSTIDSPGAGTGTQAGGSGVTNSSGGNPTGTGSGGSGSSCGSGQYVTSSGGCATTSTPSSSNAASYQWAIDLAIALMAIVAILSVLALIFQNASWFTAAIAQALKAIIVILGLMIAGLGAIILSMSGDKMMGGITTIVGVMIAGWAYFSTATDAAGAVTIVPMAAGSLIASAAGALAASAASASKISM